MAPLTKRAAADASWPMEELNVRMDEQSSQQEAAEILSARSASALQALGERARAALEASREQASNLENEITGRLETIAAALAAHRAVEAQTDAGADDRREELERLQKEFHESRAAWLLERAELESTREQLTQKIATLESERAAGAQNAAEAGELRGELDRLTRELSESRDAWDREKVELESGRAELTEEVAKLQAKQFADAKAAEDVARLQGDIDALKKEFSESQAAWLLEQSELEATRDRLAQQVTKLQSERDADLQTAEEAAGLEAEVDRLKREIAEARATWLLERSELETSRDRFSQQVAKLQAAERSAREEWANQLASFEQKLREQQTAWNEQRAEWQESTSAIEQERDAMQQKFELALQDVQRLRGRVAELEQELARRPEGTAADSAELVALRAERDALAERIEELERQPAQQADANSEQQLADLQRRFELAVEDVRELKTKNAQLEAQLANGAKTAGRPADTGGLDWESQKRRLLASLEDEGDASDEPERQEERVRIESTIEMTDAVVAQKDREIEELKAQLAQGGAAAQPAEEDDREQQVREIIDADEVIAEHRKRVAQLEREMEEKLRAAELELSLERAKIARERVELDEVRADLEALKADVGPSGAGQPGAPRRRWLSKLGLSGEEQA